jgi:hypothetical protein
MADYYIVGCTVNAQSYPMLKRKKWRKIILNLTDAVTQQVLYLQLKNVEYIMPMIKRLPAILTTTRKFQSLFGSHKNSLWERIVNVTGSISPISNTYLICEGRHRVVRLINNYMEWKKICVEFARGKRYFVLFIKRKKQCYIRPYFNIIYQTSDLAFWYDKLFKHSGPTKIPSNRTLNITGLLQPISSKTKKTKFLIS